MSIPEESPKLCLSCCRRALAKQPPQNCGTCIVLNTDPLAQVRASSARPSVLDRFISSACLERDEK